MSETKIPNIAEHDTFFIQHERFSFIGAKLPTIIKLEILQDFRIQYVYLITTPSPILLISNNDPLFPYYELPLVKQLGHKEFNGRKAYMYYI